MIRLSKRRIYLLFWTILTICFAIYGEFLIYYFNVKNWNSMKCKNESYCTKILLVADPQIIGTLNEHLHFITPVSIYDSDKYLKKTFEHAKDFVKPDVMVFLGDLMDEAHIANDEDFYDYVKRIFRIFLDESVISPKHIWLPGDNNIGGEDTKVTPKKLQRFERAFSQPTLIKEKNITFFKINRLTSIIPVYKKERDFYNVDNIFVGFSHVPLMFRPSQFVIKVINKMLPHVIFSAHEHKAMIINTDALLRQDFHITPINYGNNEIFEYSLGVTDMYEILVPTCSYRMGTLDIGYGFAIIESTNLRFTVLWSPSRFHQLFAYFLLLVAFVFTTVLVKCYGSVLKPGYMRHK